MYSGVLEQLDTARFILGHTITDELEAAIANRKCVRILELAIARFGGGALRLGIQLQVGQIAHDAR